MNDQQIYTLMAKTPGIRAAEVAEALGVTLADASDALRELVEVGDAVRSAGHGPDGRQAQIYNLSDEFKRSPKYASLAVGVLPRPAFGGVLVLPGSTPISSTAPTAAPTAAPTPAPASPTAAAAAPAPVSELASERRLSPMMRTERAMAFLRERGDQGARSLELAEAMGLRADQSPSNFLRTARERGQIKSTDGRWYYIDRAAPQGAQVAPAAAPTGPFRCGIWLDGEIELQRGGATIDKLARDEALVLRDFLNRVLPAEVSP